MLSQALEENQAVVRASLEVLVAPFDACLAAMAAAVAGGGTVHAFGNGGSAAQALHFTAELSGRYEQDRPAIPAVALVADTVALTASANDYGFEHALARQVEALVRPADVVVAISTSGRSPNVLAAVEAARARGAVTIGLTGAGGEALASVVDHALVVPSLRVPRIQEVHAVVLHALAEGLELRHAGRSAR